MGDLEVMEKLAHDLQFENQLKQQEIEKELQIITDLERGDVEMKSEMKQEREEVARLHDEIKLGHVQLDENRKTSESLSATCDLLMEQEQIMKKRLEDLRIKGEATKAARLDQVNRYKSVYEDYREKYENFPMARDNKEKRDEIESIRRKTAETRIKIQEMQKKIDAFESRKALLSKVDVKDFQMFNDEKDFIIRIAEMKVGNKKIETEIEQKRNICSELKKEMEARLREDEQKRRDLEMEERREKEELAGKLLQADRQKKEEMNRRQEMESSDVKLGELKRMKDAEGCTKGADTVDKNSRSYRICFDNQKQMQSDERKSVGHFIRTAPPEICLPNCVMTTSDSGTDSPSTRIDSRQASDNLQLVPPPRVREKGSEKNNSTWFQIEIPKDPRQQTKSVNRIATAAVEGSSNLQVTSRENGGKFTAPPSLIWSGEKSTWKNQENIAPSGEKSTWNRQDILAPSGEKSKWKRPDILAPSGEKSTWNRQDILAPSGEKSTWNRQDILAPSGEKSTWKRQDILAPSGEKSTWNRQDILAPSGEKSTWNRQDILAPSGEKSTWKRQDILAPSGEKSTWNRQDILAPSGEKSSWNRQDILAPSGEKSTWNRQDILAPSGEKSIPSKQERITASSEVNLEHSESMDLDEIPSIPDTREESNLCQNFGESCTDPNVDYLPSRNVDPLVEGIHRDNQASKRRLQVSDKEEPIKRLTDFNIDDCFSGFRSWDKSPAETTSNKRKTCKLTELNGSSMEAQDRGKVGQPLIHSSLLNIFQNICSPTDEKSEHTEDARSSSSCSPGKFNFGISDDQFNFTSSKDDEPDNPFSLFGMFGSSGTADKDSAFSLGVNIDATFSPEASNFTGSRSFSKFF